MDESDPEDCADERRISLQAIVDAFNAPIKFDHAWAIVYMVSF